MGQIRSKKEVPDIPKVGEVNCSPTRRVNRSLVNKQENKECQVKAYSCWWGGLTNVTAFKWLHWSMAHQGRRTPLKQLSVSSCIQGGIFAGLGRVMVLC